MNNMENIKEETFRKKANDYLVCYNEYCARHEHCLRWQVGKYVKPSLQAVTCINPNYAPAVEGRCDFYRDDQPVKMPIGMKTKFYEDMPARMAYRIKNALIDYNCRSTYYRYHNGLRPITPAYETLIRSVCNRFGWSQPLQFDDEVIDYVWE